MSEERIFFSSQSLRIEGLWQETAGREAAVVSHPHPLYGGDMFNPVVEAIIEAYRLMGYSTLRFNFRGVGHSQGDYDEGMGEQEDVRAALDFVLGKGKSSIDLAGYSFGAWVNGRAAHSTRAVGRLIMVSPPVAFLDFSFLGRDDRIRLVIAGSRDSFGPPLLIQDLLRSWNPKATLRIIEGADHFYGGVSHKVVKAMQEDLAG